MQIESNMTGKINTADNSGEDDEFTFNPPRESERDNSTDSPAETDHDGEDPSLQGDDNSGDDSDKDKPFHEQPRWKEREEEWNTRFNDQETRHQEDLKKALDGIRDEFKDARKENQDNVEIPSWFGGDEKQWNAYRADRDRELREAEDRAEKRAIDRIEGKKSTEDKAVQEATEYMHSELKVITADKTLNPDAVKLDPNKLVQFTIDNELVDTKGRWNYRAAFKMMKAQGLIKPASTVSKDRKEIAGATTGKDSKDDTAPKAYKTSADFKSKKPW